MTARKRIAAKRAPSAKRTRSKPTGRKRAESVPAGAPSPTVDAQTIVYIHGIGNQPVPSVLKELWDRALFGYELGERSRLAYWVNRDRYLFPVKPTAADSDPLDIPEVVPPAMGARARRGRGGVSDIQETIDAVAESPEERRALERIAQEMLERHEPESGQGRRRAGAGGEGSVRTRRVGKRVIPLIGAAGRAFLTRFVTSRALPDVRDFLFDDAKHQEWKQRFRDALLAGNGPLVVIAHSLGSVIAYMVLAELSAERTAGKLDTDLRIPLLLTIGSPLGMQEIREQINKRLGRKTGARLLSPSIAERWVNANDFWDPVALDHDLADDVSGAPGVEDKRVDNPAGMRHAHAATGYLSIPEVRDVVKKAISNARFQRLAKVTLTRDLVRRVEDSVDTERTDVLFELTQPEDQPDLTIDMMGDALTEQLEAMRKASGIDKDEMGIERLRHYVAASLTKTELYTTIFKSKFLVGVKGGVDQAELAEFKGKKSIDPIYRAWRNATKYALINRSIHTVQAHPAHSAYGARGRGIEWAVLDTGMGSGDKFHPHFMTHGSIAMRWDCTRLGPARANEGADGDGHGTHVAGIIAGETALQIGSRDLGRKLVDRRENADWEGSVAADRANEGQRSIFSGMAPECKLHIYKVLDDDGTGRDAWIIKALDHIAGVNERAGTLKIHGVNLSLGGPFDVEAFGCGHSPLCDELRRLWQQGVVVVLAAGNAGYARVLSLNSDGENEEIDANMALSIEDPANLDEAIAVGSVHRTRPHTYGISFFSSRGPTADGRQKPDCVAPGEQILSCRFDWVESRAGQSPAIDDLFVAFDGTSMAAPHVSGLIAAFLSQRREFIGQPDRIKRILLENCTDLRRDRTMQGAGMPNLVRMLVGT